MAAWGQIAAGILSGAGNLVEGFANLSRKRRRRLYDEQQEYSQQAADYNYYLDQQAADAAHQRQMMLFNTQARYNDPSQQAARLRAAGFNPALAYSNGGGVTGVSMPAAQGHQGGTMRPPSPHNPMSFTSGIDIISMQNMRADKELKEAQAALLRTQAENQRPDSEVGSAQLEHLKAQTSDLIESIENRKVQRYGWEIENDLRKLEYELAKETQEINIELAHYRLRDASLGIDKMIHEVSILKSEDIVKRETISEAITSIVQQVKLQSIEYSLREIEIEAKRKGIELTDSQINDMRDSANREWSKHFADIEHHDIDKLVKMRGQEFTMWGMINKGIEAIGVTLDEKLGIDSEDRRRYRRLRN